MADKAFTSSPIRKIQPKAIIYIAAFHIPDYYETHREEANFVMFVLDKLKKNETVGAVRDQL
jgi:hypothetical protein